MTANDRPDWDEYFLGMAVAASKRASCVRRMVGAVMVDEARRVVATGYNGAPSGLPHCIDGGCPRGYVNSVAPDSDYSTPGSPGFCVAAHAEKNALLHSTRDLEGCTMYVTHRPCPDCTRDLAAAGIDRAVFPGGEFVPKDELWRMSNDADA